MIEKALRGNSKYWGWIGFLFVVIFVGTLFYLRQFGYGLGITGLNRDVTWGLYIAQFTFLVGVAASAVMVVLPYYLHNYKAFGKITILGEILAIASVMMCGTFIFVDMGQPLRIINVFRYPTPHSLMFWDTIALGGYLMLNVIISINVIASEKKGTPPPGWLKPLIIISIPWAISIHTVTAFLYSGLAARPFWMTAILAPRFLASAFAGGPALLILLCLFLKKTTRFDPGREPIQKIGIIVTYAMSLNVFFVLMEIFTAFYSGIPEHIEHFRFLYVGLEGNNTLVPWMWTSSLLAIISLVLLYVPRARKNEAVLGLACVTVFFSIWIEKGLGMVITGFVPNPFGEASRYWPTFTETMIALGVYAIGFLVVTVLYKATLSIRGEVST
jgi:molybdopterin-containing oxidoreductase family membrane subunit